MTPSVRLALLALVGSLAGWTQPLLPPPHEGEIEFARDIAPILESACVRCHGRGRSQGGFRLDTRELILRESATGPPVVPGDSAGSYLVELVAGVDPDFVMPQKGTRLTPEEVGLLRAWIDRNLPWDDQVDFLRRPSPNLASVRPGIPGGIRGWLAVHPVDAFLADHFGRQGFVPSDPVDDRTYARRVWLDVLGLLPPPEELEEFLEDPRFDKRSRLVVRLLADDRHYAEHWLSFWNDLLRNDYRGTGFIDGGRRQISDWLHRNLVDNRPYDEFVRDLVSGSPGAEGFVKGIVWRGVVNASQQPAMQAAQNVSQVFLGVNLKCASCHDSFIDDWTLEDAYGMAGYFAEGPLPMHRCDRPTGRTAPIKYLHDPDGHDIGSASRRERMAELADRLVHRENGRFTRTIVNRLWARLFGEGLVPGPDDMESTSRIPGLLDWLAEDLADHDYDLKHTLALLLTSRTYQLPAVPSPESPGASLPFRGPLVRRLSAEQFVDALGSLAGSRFRNPANREIDLSRGLAPADRRALEARLEHARWIAPRAPGEEPFDLGFRFTLEDLPAVAEVWTAATGGMEFFINDHRAGEAGQGGGVHHWSLRDHLARGENRIRVRLRPHATPALYALIRLAASPSRESRERYLGSGADWSGGVQVLESAPLDIGAKLVRQMNAVRQIGRIRASLVASDPLSRALGRPNREQVVTTRATRATTLQALELTNGDTLAEWLARIAPAMAARHRDDAAALVDSLYLAGLGRRPTPNESRLCLSFLEGKDAVQGLEDLLWSLIMLPEFQLIL